MTSLDQIKDPSLRAALQSLGEGVHQQAERARCVATNTPYWKPGRKPQHNPYERSVEAIAAYKAREGQQFPEKELPSEPSPPIVPLSEDAKRTQTLIEFQQNAKPTVGLEQLELPL